MRLIAFLSVVWAMLKGKTQSESQTQTPAPSPTLFYQDGYMRDEVEALERQTQEIPKV